MYNPSGFREERPEVLHKLIETHPLGLLITAGPEGPMASSIPLQLRSEGDQVRLVGHMARANPHVAALAEATTCLIVFQGAQAYVSPAWYPSKAQNPKVVPTWNYIQVQVRGVLKLIEDADWLRAQLEDITNAHEAASATPWMVDDAPADFIAMQMRAIMGLEIAVSAMEGKWKISQNRQPQDQAGVMDRLRAAGHDDMAEIMTARLRSET